MSEKIPPTKKKSTATKKNNTELSKSNAVKSTTSTKLASGSKILSTKTKSTAKSVSTDYETPSVQFKIKEPVSQTPISLSHPLKYISTQQSIQKVVILPQSQNKVLIVWHAPPEQDYQFSAWKFRTNTGTDILLPIYSRSVFLDISLLGDELEFELFQVDHEQKSHLYQSYKRSSAHLRSQQSSQQQGSVFNLSSEELQKHYQMQQKNRHSFFSGNHF